VRQSQRQAPQRHISPETRQDLCIIKSVERAPFVPLVHVREYDIVAFTHTHTSTATHTHTLTHAHTHTTALTHTHTQSHTHSITHARTHTTATTHANALVALVDI
jgi:hypothetical protein